MLQTKFQVPASQGLAATIHLMNQLELKAFQNPYFVSWVYRNFASDCVSCIPGKIWTYIKNNFTYLSDDPFDEIITAPYLMLEKKSGDCDDFSLFVKTCLDILGGWNTKYLLLAKEKNRYSHIVVFANRGTVNNHYVDPVIIDGANDIFNVINPIYKFRKII